MAHDEDLTDRIRELIASEEVYTEPKMLGGICVTGRVAFAPALPPKKKE